MVLNIVESRRWRTWGLLGVGGTITNESGDRGQGTGTGNREQGQGSGNSQIMALGTVLLESVWDTRVFEGKAIHRMGRKILIRMDRM